MSIFFSDDWKKSHSKPLFANIYVRFTLLKYIYGLLNEIFLINSIKQYFINSIELVQNVICRSLNTGPISLRRIVSARQKMNFLYIKHRFGICILFYL